MRLEAWEQGWEPGNEAEGLGTRLEAWEQGWEPGNETGGLGSRLDGSPTRCSSLYSPRCRSLFRMVSYCPMDGYQLGSSRSRGRCANICTIFWSLQKWCKWRINKHRKNFREPCSYTVSFLLEVKLSYTATLWSL